MKTSTSMLGSDGETAACRWLGDAGFRIVDRNWRRSWGELDIVAIKNGVVRFIEVKTSRSRSPGFEPFVRANGLKMSKVARTARTWLAAHGYGPDTEWQMDILSVIMVPTRPEFELLENI